MTKNSHGKILRGEPKEQHLNIIPKSCPIPHMKSNVYYQPNGKNISFTKYMRPIIQ